MKQQLKVREEDIDYWAVTTIGHYSNNTGIETFFSNFEAQGTVNFNVELKDGFRLIPNLKGLNWFFNSFRFAC